MGAKLIKIGGKREQVRQKVQRPGGKREQGTLGWEGTEGAEVRGGKK